MLNILKQTILPLGKMLLYNDYSLFLLSAIGATGFITSANYFDIIIDGTDIKNLVLPICIEVIGITLFVIFSIIHTITGLQAAKHEYKEATGKDKVKIHEWFDTDKIWQMYWKTLGVILFTTMVMLITILTEIMASKYLYITMLWLLVTLMFLACGFEFQSIGNNLARVGKKRYDIFLLVDKIIGVVQNNLIDKLKNNKNE